MGEARGSASLRPVGLCLGRPAAALRLIIQADPRRREWSVGELGAQCSLRPEDIALLAGMVDAGKLGFASRLAFWRQNGRFPAEDGGAHR